MVYVAWRHASGIVKVYANGGIGNVVDCGNDYNGELPQGWEMITEWKTIGENQWCEVNKNWTMR